MMSITPPVLLAPLVTVMGSNQALKPLPNRPMAVTCSLATKYMWFEMCEATTTKSMSEVWFASNEHRLVVVPGFFHAHAVRRPRHYAEYGQEQRVYAAVVVVRSALRLLPAHSVQTSSCLPA